MGKYILINGVKHYIKEDGQPADQPTDEPAETPAEAPADEPETPEAPADENVEEEAKSIAKNIMQKINAEIDNLDQLKQLNAKVDRIMNDINPMDSKLKDILAGKDLNSNELTKDEKIVGFFYACVTNNHAAVKALGEGNSADGGYLVPDEFRAEVVRELQDITYVRRLARVVPMKRKTLNAASVVSGPQVYWTNENAVKSTTTAHFGQPTLTAYKLAAILYASDELIEDSDQVDVVQLVIQLFAEAIAREEDKAFGQGSGSGQPTGLDTATTAGTITGVTCSGNLDFDDIINLEYSLNAQYRANAVYLVHKNNLRELRKIKDNNGQYLWQPSQQAGEPATLNGRPVYEFNWISEANMYFGDFKRGYWFGDRKTMTVLLSQHTTNAFTKDETAIRVVERVAGNVVWANAIKVLSSIP